MSYKDNKPIRWWEWLFNVGTVLISLGLCFTSYPAPVAGGFFLLATGFTFGMRLRGRLDYLERGQ